MAFHALTFARSRGRLKTEAEGRGSQHLPKGPGECLMHCAIIAYKTENISYISHYFLHYFVLPFHRCRTNAISTDYARSRAGQYTSRDGSNYFAPVQAY